MVLKDLSIHVPKNPPIYLKIPTGHYESVDVIAREMNALFKSIGIDLVLYNSSINKRITISGTDKYSIKFSAPLAYMLSFEPDEWVRTAAKLKSKYPCHINGGHYNFFVYTNIMEAQCVGDYVVPLLRIIKKEGSYGDLITFSYNRLHYVPVNKTAHIVQYIYSNPLHIREDNPQATLWTLTFI